MFVPGGKTQAAGELPDGVLSELSKYVPFTAKEELGGTMMELGPAMVTVPVAAKT